MGDLFSRNKHSSNEKSLPERWDPPSAQMIQVPAGRSDIFPLHELHGGHHIVAANFEPTIIIGLGETGSSVLEQWFELTAHYESGSFDNIRILLITASGQRHLPQQGSYVRQILLPDQNTGKYTSLLGAFRDAASIRQFQEWLQSALFALRDIQVLIVGSAAEPEVCLLGPVLQILRTFPESTVSPYLNIVALLSLAAGKSGSNGISLGERYAALREAGRFTFSGWHKAIELSNRRETVVRSALLDHLFLFDETTFQEDNIDVRLREIEQALSESVYFLSHPVSREFWGTLKNNMAGQFRQEYHEPAAHTVGIKTLFVPLAEIQSYLAVRLANAVLFGERPQDVMDQLVPRGSLSIEQPDEDILARRWLLDDGPGAHPIFEWLWNTPPSVYHGLPPEVSVLYNELYAIKVSHSLAKFLNEAADVDKFNVAIRVLKAHKKRFDRILSSMVDGQSLRQANFIQMLRRWVTTCEHLDNMLEGWRKTFEILDVEHKSSSFLNHTPSMETAAARLRLDWEKPSPLTDGRTPVSDQTVFTLIHEAQEKAEKRLENVAGGKVRIALTHGAQDSLVEVENYYRDTIRPEMSHLGMGASRAYTWVRNRLSWWIRLEPLQEPEILLVCWPNNLNVEAGTKPSSEYCYSWQDRQKIVDSVISLAATQINGLTDDLTGGWFARRLANAVRTFQDKVEEAYLDYDENILGRYLDHVDKRRYYLIGKDKDLTGRFVKPMFPYRLPVEVNEIDGSDPTRFTALTARLNIPFSAIRTISDWRESYSRFNPLHTYPQERLARMYEDLIFRRTGNALMFSSDFVLALTDEKLVTLFCQALLCQLIRVERNDMKQSLYWQVDSVGTFPPLNLASSSENGLLDAFRAFTLDLPNDQYVDRNPANHFSSARRNDFLTTLLKETRLIRRSSEFKSLQAEFNNGILARWQDKGKDGDLLSLSFAALLQMELQEPVWDGWYSE